MAVCRVDLEVLTEVCVFRRMELVDNEVLIGRDGSMVLGVLIEACVFRRVELVVIVELFEWDEANVEYRLWRRNLESVMLLVTTPEVIVWPWRGNRRYGRLEYCKALDHCFQGFSALVFTILYRFTGNSEEAAVIEILRLIGFDEIVGPECSTIGISCTTVVITRRGKRNISYKKCSIRVRTSGW